MPGFMDRLSGRFKKAAGDLVDDPKLRREGAQEERKAEAKEELAEAQQRADMKAEEVARLERQGSRREGEPEAGAGVRGHAGARADDPVDPAAGPGESGTREGRRL